MTESAGTDSTQQKPEQTVTTEVQGDAVINNAPDGGGVDNEAAAAEQDSSDGEQGSETS